MRARDSPTSAVGAQAVDFVQQGPPGGARINLHWEDLAHAAALVEVVGRGALVALGLGALIFFGMGLSPSVEMGWLKVDHVRPV